MDSMLSRADQYFRHVDVESPDVAKLGDAPETVAALLFPPVDEKRRLTVQSNSTLTSFPECEQFLATYAVHFDSVVKPHEGNGGYLAMVNIDTDNYELSETFKIEAKAKTLTVAVLKLNTVMDLTKWKWSKSCVSAGLQLGVPTSRWFASFLPQVCMDFATKEVTTSFPVACNFVMTGSGACNWDEVCSDPVYPLAKSFGESLTSAAPSSDSIDTTLAEASDDKAKMEKNFEAIGNIMITTVQRLVTTMGVNALFDMGSATLTSLLDIDFDAELRVCEKMISQSFDVSKLVEAKPPQVGYRSMVKVAFLQESLMVLNTSTMPLLEDDPTPARAPRADPT